MEFPSVGTFQAEVSGPAWGAKTAPILGVAGPATVTLARLGAVDSPVSRWARCNRHGARLAGQPAPTPKASSVPGITGTFPSAMVSQGRHGAEQQLHATARECWPADPRALQSAERLHLAS